MISEKILLDESNPKVYVNTYLLENSGEYNTDKLRPAVLILPGGGYEMTTDREAEFVALAFAAKGYHAFVLRYSVKENAKMPRPIIEAFQTIKLIRERSDEWYVDSDKLTVCGFSAGGHLASCTLTMWNDPVFMEAVGADSSFIRPDAGILSYPCIVFPFRTDPVKTDYAEDMLDEVIKQALPDLQLDSAEDAGDLIYADEGFVWMDFAKIFNRLLMGKKDFTMEEIKKYSTDLRVNADTPPTFVWTTRTDQTVPAEDSLAFVNAMVKNGCDVEFHMFGDGIHGLSLAEEQTSGAAELICPHVAKWFPLALEWLDGILEKKYY